MKVAIYHPFGSFPDNYSLSHIVKEQFQMLQENGIETYFITSTHFKGEVLAGVNVWKMLPRTEIPKKITLSFMNDIYPEVMEVVPKLDYVFTHDIVYINSYLAHDKAIRQLTEFFPHIKWLHWIHSAPNPNDKRMPIPNSTYIGMNYTDLPLLAEQFQVPLGQCRVVYNPVDPSTFFGWHSFTKYLVDKHNLLDCDVLVTYPIDTGRFEAKGGYKIIKLIEKIRAKGKNAKVVFVNAAANTKERRRLAESLANENVIFTSVEALKKEPTPFHKYDVVVPRQVVRDLFQISNLFPLLSISEGCSLIMIEAGLSKNLVVLNEDFPAMREFGEMDHVLYMKTSSTRATTTYNPSEDKYFEDYADIILGELGNNKALRFNRKMLKRFNRKWIWKNQLEPLIKTNFIEV